MGDGPALNIPSQVNITSAGNTCNVNEKNMCCWQGTTANPCDNTNGEGYHGCTRTICDYYAAKYICENFYAGGNTWRLATLSEMSTWKTNSVDIGVNGLQLCDNNSGYSSAYCKNAYNCPGSSSDCFPNSLWSSESADTSNTYIYYLENGIWNNSIKNNMDAYSVRCVTNFKSCIDKIGPGCLSCDGDTCLSCDFGYILTDGKCKLNCPEKYGKWCTECNDTECTGCNDAFKVGSNPSSTNACEFNCTGVNFMKINNICVTRKNMGDSELLTIPSSYQNSCYKTGNTNCNSNNSSYSGCNRTVCKRSTGRNICSAFNFDNRTWELPTRSDVSSWDDYSLGKGDEGLQLCTQNSGSSKANYCNTSSSYYPFRVWTRSTSSTSGDTEYIYYKLNTSDGWSSSKTSSGSGKYSIRCITDF